MSRDGRVSLVERQLRVLDGENGLAFRLDQPPGTADRGHDDLDRHVPEALAHLLADQRVVAHVAQTDENDDVDDAWTAPVYIGPGKAEVDDTAAEQPAKARAEESLVGSRKSSVYHYASCSSVKSIKPENLVRYASAPEDKQLHKGCPVR